MLFHKENDMSKRKQRFQWERDAKAGTVKVTDKVTGESVTLKAGAYSADIQHEVLVYGMTTLHRDRVSDIEPADTLAAIRETDAMLRAGRFEKERVGGMPTLAVEVEAIMEDMGWDAKRASAAWKAATDQGKADALRTKMAESISRL